MGARRERCGIAGYERIEEDPKPRAYSARGLPVLQS